MQDTQGISKKHKMEIGMSRVPKSRMTIAHTLDIDLAKLMSDSERGIRIQAKNSIHTTFCRHGLKLQKQIVTLDDILRSDGEDTPSFPEHGTTSALESLPSS